LERMRRIAELALGEPVTQAVITVPAYFNDAQRQATKDAGRIAGLDVRRILNEPTAAALAYGAHKDKRKKNLVVFDLGGGTFDVSVLSIDKGLFEVLAVNGDSALGGEDFDRRIVERLVEEFRETHRVDLATDPMALGRLKEEAERAKKALSEEPHVSIRLPFVATPQSGEPLHLDRTLSRAELEELSRPLLERLAPPCLAALKDSSLKETDIDEILLVGGMSRMPAVQEEVARIFGRKPSKGANPDEIVALGAASHGGILSGDLDDVVLLDVIPQSLGIRVGESGFSVVIPRNTTVPTRVTKTFATSRSDQRFVSVEVYQGDSKDVRENKHLGKFTLDGLPPGPAGSVRVELDFMVDVDGLVRISARELSTGRETALTIAPSGGLGEEELNRIVDSRRSAQGQGG
ncbi:MAG: Hsp70 family protein, partial [Deltaproteobacteria bacterium]|nr:Hsp70 family protein [Deltaproteobacteria bacterium]